MLTEDAFNQQFTLINMGDEAEDHAQYGLGVLVAGEDTGHNGSVLGYQIQMFSSKGAAIVIYTNCYYLSKENISQIIYENTKDILETYGALQ